MFVSSFTEFLIVVKEWTDDEDGRRITNCCIYHSSRKANKVIHIRTLKCFHFLSFPNRQETLRWFPHSLNFYFFFFHLSRNERHVPMAAIHWNEPSPTQFGKTPMIREKKNGEQKRTQHKQQSNNPQGLFHAHLQDIKTRYLYITRAGRRVEQRGGARQGEGQE